MWWEYNVVNCELKTEEVEGHKNKILNLNIFHLGTGPK